MLFAEHYQLTSFGCDVIAMVTGCLIKGSDFIVAKKESNILIGTVVEELDDHVSPSGAVGVQGDTARHDRPHRDLDTVVR